MLHERCRFCDRVSPIDFSVPDNVWEAVVPTMFQSETLCVLCFAYFGDTRGIAWEEGMQLFPLSKVTISKLKLER